MSKYQELKQLCKSYALEFKDCGNGHVQIKGHGSLVNYWPESKRRTAFVKATGESVPHCSNWDAVKLCMQNGKVGLKPRKKAITKEAAKDIKPTLTNPMQHESFYNGETPPWEFPGPYIGCIETLEQDFINKWDLSERLL